MKFTITGKHPILSKEELRAIVQSCITVLEFHGGRLKTAEMTVQIVPDGSMGKTRLNPNSDAAGRAFVDEGRFEMIGIYEVENTMTLVLHECIHLMFDLHTELATSTLTNRLKPTVCEIYDTLIEGVYQRAAYVAHTKIAYKPYGDDHYNDEQYEKVGVSTMGKKYRKKVCGKCGAETPRSYKGQMLPNGSLEKVCKKCHDELEAAEKSDMVNQISGDA